MNTAQFESHNPNSVGGDITGGIMDIRQLVARPTARWTPYRTAHPQIFICSMMGNKNDQSKAPAETIRRGFLTSSQYYY